LGLDFSEANAAKGEYVADGTKVLNLLFAE